MDIGAIGRLHHKGLASVQATIHFGQMTTNSRNLIMRAITEGLYPGGYTINCETYRGIMRAMGLPFAYVRKGHHGWDIIFNNDVPLLPEVYDGFMRLTKADVVALTLSERAGSYWGDQTRRENNLKRGYMDLRDHGLRSLDALKEITRIYATQKQYVDKTRPILDAIASKQTVTVNLPLK